MAITITHDQATSTGGDDYLSWWEGEFVTGDHPDNTGGFYPGMFSGSQYAMSSGEAGHTAGFIASGDLNYTLFSPPTHTLYGELDTLEFGDQITQGGNGYSFNSGPELGIDGLDLSSGAVADNQIHDIVYGLMEGDATALEDYLNTEDLTVNGSSTRRAAISRRPGTATSGRGCGCTGWPGGSTGRRWRDWHDASATTSR